MDPKAEMMKNLEMSASSSSMIDWKMNLLMSKRTLKLFNLCGEKPLQIGAVAIHQKEEAKNYYNLMHVE